MYLDNEDSNFSELCRLGLPLPDGFIINTDNCVHNIMTQEKSYETNFSNLVAQYTEAIKELGVRSGKEFGI